MPRPRLTKREHVTVSFHFLQRQDVGEGGEINVTPFTEEEFAQLHATLAAAQRFDFSSEEVRASLRTKNIVPVDSVTLENPRTIFGRFKGSYWGHAYENTHRGDIPADSVSLRPFYFLLYLSESGKIYIACQYLAQFGDYLGFKGLLLKLLRNSGNIVAHSVRADYVAAESVTAKEVAVTVARSSEQLAANNRLAGDTVIIFKRSERDQAFDQEIKRRLWPVLNTNKQDIQRAVARLAADQGIMSVADEDIKDCTIVAQGSNRRDRRIHMIGASSFATQFPIDVMFHSDGHPEAGSAKNAMLNALEAHVIARTENG